MSRSPLDLAGEAARRYLDGLGDRCVAATVSRADLISRFDVPLGRAGIPAEQVVEELIQAPQRGV